MSQRLILPINNCKLTASWKTAAYKNKYGFAHYGVDMVSTMGATTLYASGDGEVLAVGTDNVVGNIVVVKYSQAYNRVTGKVQNIIFRYFHLASIAVKKGDKVTKDTPLGKYGNTGYLPMAAHLHLEADTDTAHPLYSPTVKSSSLLKGTSLGANDASMTNPMEWLYLKQSLPENQTYATSGDAYISAADTAIEFYDEPEPPEQSKLDQLQEENGKLRSENTELSAKLSALEGKLKQINQLSA